MKKVLIVFVAIASLLLVSYGSSYAIQGQCVNCHTMHNSQNGTRMADQDTPYGSLLRAGCISCHTQNGAGQGATNTYGAPIVFHTTNPAAQGGGYTLAGGDFYWVATGYGATDSTGHNVAGIAGVDAAIAANLGNYVPPGWDAGATPGALNDGQITVSGGTGSWSTQLNCAGTYGCHGVHNQSGDFPGMKGAHHNNPGIAQTQADTPTTIGDSYRFLSGIKGLENSQWNWNETTSSHNEYFGSNDLTVRSSTAVGYANKRTISYMCAECHGAYHSYIDAAPLGTPWLRHPTDIVLGRGAGTEYSAYNPDGGNQYSLQAPVARASVPADSSPTINTASDIVMCLSCHRAHGSNQPDILRWDYSGMIAGSTAPHTGCFVCHTTKNG